VQDSGADLNAYAKVENQSGCCSPAMEEPKRKTVGLQVSSGCCGGSTATACCETTAEPASTDVHTDLRALLEQYDVNQYAASVKVYAVK
jgi:arsenite methyltransferase